MYRKDLITAEIQRLAEVLAQMMGLKLEGKLKEAEAIFNETMQNKFDLDPAILAQTTSNEFDNWLHHQNLSPEKLDTLSEFLYYELGISEERNQAVAPKLNLIYNFLSAQHKIVHLVNLHRQETIQQYLK